MRSGHGWWHNCSLVDKIIGKEVRSGYWCDGWSRWHRFYLDNGNDTGMKYFWEYLLI